MAFSSSNKTLVVNDTWKSALKDLCRAQDAKRQRIVAIVGPKNVGKSTFARELCRRWLDNQVADASAVAFLDTDLGRPEFMLAGTISLHSFSKPQQAASKANNNTPNNNNNKKSSDETPAETQWEAKLEGAIFMGEDDPSVRPEYYVEATKRMGSLAKSKFQLVVVNTHGWFSGLGQDILEAVLINTGATDVVQIVPENKLATLGTLLKPSEAFKVQTLLPAKESRQRESKSSREHRVFEYFNKGEMHAVGMRKVRIRYPVGVIDHALPSQHALLALNASICGLSAETDGMEDDPLSFLGFGLIASIDLDRELLFVLTPLAFERLRTCTTLTMATSSRVSLTSFPSRFKPEGDSLVDEDFEVADEDDLFVPYISSCKLVGFGSIQPPKMILKRRRLENDA